MKLTVLAIAFAFGGFSAAAQSAAPGFTTFSAPAISSGCPVSLKLQQTLAHQLETVQNGKVIKAPATQLTLTVGFAHGGSSFGYGVAGMEGLSGSKQPSAPARPRRIASATATVHGFGARPHAELISPGANKHGNGWSAPVRIVKLRFNSRDGQTAAELWLPSFGAVRSLTLNSITYADGSTWKPARGETCIITPDPFMLVGSDSAAGPSNH